VSRTLKLLVILGTFVGVFALTWVLYFPHSPLGRQEANLGIAREHQVIVEERLQRLRGAERVRVAVSTGYGGCLTVEGAVADQEAAEMVIEEVSATRPPVIVRFLIFAGESDLVERIVEPTAAGNSRPAVQSSGL
jgi:hypothetical protein